MKTITLAEVAAFRADDPLTVGVALASLADSAPASMHPRHGVPVGFDEAAIVRAFAHSRAAVPSADSGGVTLAAFARRLVATAEVFAPAPRSGVSIGAVVIHSSWRAA